MNISAGDKKKICEWAGQHPEIKRVYLYGSRARGDNRDIDLGIMMNPTRHQSSFTRWFFWHERYKKNPDLLLEYAVDLQWYEKDAGLKYVGPGVERDGIVIYEE